MDREEIDKMIDGWFRENPTVVQYQRFKLLMDGMSIRDVARYEGIDYSSTNESIKVVQKKIEKIRLMKTEI